MEVYKWDDKSVYPFNGYGFYHHFVDKEGEYPFYWPESVGVWFLPSWSSGLFIKWDNFMLYKIYGDKKYPPVKNMIFDSLLINYPDFEMHRLYDKIYTSKYENIKKFYLEDMTKYYRKCKTICFKELHSINRSGFNGFYFLDRSMRVKFRDDGYRITNINTNTNNANKRIAEIGVIIRKYHLRRREIININDIILLLKEIIRNNDKIKYEVIYFDEKSTKDQILLIMNKQIIITPHGANLCNILWIVNNKATILECYSIFRTDAYLKLSIMMNYRYFPLASPHVHAFNIINNSSLEYDFNDFPYIHHNRYFYHPLKYYASADIAISIKQMLFGILLSFNELKVN